MERGRERERGREAENDQEQRQTVRHADEMSKRLRRWKEGGLKVGGIKIERPNRGMRKKMKTSSNQKKVCQPETYEIFKTKTQTTCDCCLPSSASTVAVFTIRTC